MRLVAIDTETSGFTSQAEIVQLGVVSCEDGGIPEQHEWLVRPQEGTGEQASKIHNITNEMVEDADDWPTVWQKAQPIIAKADYILIYNAPFDRRMVRQNCERHGIDAGSMPKLIDVLELCRIEFPDEDNKLGAVAARLGIDPGKAHSAAADALTTLKVYLHIARARRARKTRLIWLPNAEIWPQKVISNAST